MPTRIRKWIPFTYLVPVCTLDVVWKYRLTPFWTYNDLLLTASWWLLPVGNSSPTSTETASLKQPCETFHCGWWGSVIRARPKPPLTEYDFHFPKSWDIQRANHWWLGERTIWCAPKGQFIVNTVKVLKIPNDKHETCNEHLVTSVVVQFNLDCLTVSIQWHKEHITSTKTLRQHTYIV